MATRSDATELIRLLQLPRDVAGLSVGAPGSPFGPHDDLRSCAPLRSCFVGRSVPIHERTFAEAHPLDTRHLTVCAALVALTGCAGLDASRNGALEGRRQANDIAGLVGQGPACFRGTDPELPPDT
jgi:hypothetical protein